MNTIWLYNSASVANRNINLIPRNANEFGKANNWRRHWFYDLHSSIKHLLHNSRNCTGPCMVVQREGVAYIKDEANLTNPQAKLLSEWRTQRKKVRCIYNMQFVHWRLFPKKLRCSGKKFMRCLHFGSAGVWYQYVVRPHDIMCVSTVHSCAVDHQYPPQVMAGQ